MSSDEEGEDLSEESDGEGGRKSKKRKRKKKKEKKPFDRTVIVKARESEGVYRVGSKPRNERKEEGDMVGEQKPKKNRDIIVHCFFFSESPLIQWRIHVVPQSIESGGQLLAYPIHMLRIAGDADDSGLMGQLYRLAISEGHQDFALIVSQLANPKQAFSIENPAFRAWACDYALKGVLTPTREVIPDYAYAVACYVPTQEALECSEEEARTFMEAVRRDRYSALFNQTKLWMTPQQFRVRYLEHAPEGFTGGQLFEHGRVWTNELPNSKRMAMIRRKAIVGWKQKSVAGGPMNPAERVYVPVHFERMIAPLLKSLSQACYGVFEGTDAEMIGRHEPDKKALVVSLCSFQSPPGSITMLDLKARDVGPDVDLVLVGIEQPRTPTLVQALQLITSLDCNRLYMLVDLNRHRRQDHGLADLMIAPCNFFSFPRIIPTRSGGYRDIRWVQPFESRWPAANLAGPNGVVHLCVTFTLPPAEANRISFNSYSDDMMKPDQLNYRDLISKKATSKATEEKKHRSVFLRIDETTTPRDVYSMFADFYPGTPCLLLHDSFAALHLNQSIAPSSSPAASSSSLSSSPSRRA